MTIKSIDDIKALPWCGDYGKDYDLMCLCSPFICDKAQPIKLRKQALKTAWKCAGIKVPPRVFDFEFSNFCS